MTEPNPYAEGARKLCQDVWAILAVWPYNDGEKADPEREALELLMWRRLYDRQIKPRLHWMGRE